MNTLYLQVSTPLYMSHRTHCTNYYDSSGCCSYYENFTAYKARFKLCKRGIHQGSFSTLCVIVSIFARKVFRWLLNVSLINEAKKKIFLKPFLSLIYNSYSWIRPQFCTCFFQCPQKFFLSRGNSLNLTSFFSLLPVTMGSLVAQKTLHNNSPKFHYNRMNCIRGTHKGHTYKQKH